MASVAGFFAGPNMAVYHATKAYLLSLSEAVAEEISGSGITITALCPGATDTKFFASDGAEDNSFLSRLRMPSAETVATKGWVAMTKGRRVYVHGAGNKVFAFLPRLLPRRVMPFLMRQLWKRRR